MRSMDPDRRTLRAHDFTQHAAWLRRLARALVRDADPDDLVQETWLSWLRRPPPPGESTRPWLFTVLRNHARMRRRAAKSRDARERAVAEAPTEPCPSTDELLAQHDLMRVVTAAVSALPEPLRAALLLRHWEGLTSRQIAKRLGIPEGTVRWRYKQALERVRVALDERHSGDRNAWQLALAPIGARAQPPRPRAHLAFVAFAAVAIVVAGGVALGVPTLGRSRPPARSSGPRRAALVSPQLPSAGEPPVIARATLVGRVLDASGVAVKDAVVTLTNTLSRELAVASTPVPAASLRSSKAGAFRADGLAPGRYAAVATARGHGAATIDVDLKAGREVAVDLRLPSAGPVLSGTVVDREGGPVAGAPVLASPWQIFRTDDVPLAFGTTTADDGRYELALPVGSYAVRVEADGYVPAETLVAFARASTATFQLTPAASLSGRVVDRASGAPVPFATVFVDATTASLSRLVNGSSEAVEAGGGVTFSTTTANEDGHFAFHTLPAGRYVVAARSERRAGVASRAVAATLGRPGEVVVPLDPGASVEGRVVDAETDAPIPDARVTLGGQWVRPRRSAHTDATGRFRFDGLLAGPHWVRAEAVGHGVVFESFDLRDGTPRPIALRVHRSGRVSGTVRDRFGMPVVGADVRLQAADVMRTTRTAQDGRYEIAEVGPAAFELVAIAADGFASARSEALTPEAHKVIDLVLAPGAMISGTVRWDDGSPAADVAVAGAGLGALTTAASATDSAGRYTIGPFAAGTVGVLATRKGGPRFKFGGTDRSDYRNVVVASGQVRSGVDLTKGRGGRSVSGVVLGPDDRGISGALVIAGFEAGASAFPGEHALSDDEGRFVIDDVADGAFTLWASHPDYAEGEEHHIKAGATGVIVKLGVSGVVRGRVVDGDGAVTSFSVELAPSHGSGGSRSAVPGERHPTERLEVRDPAGAFEFQGCKAGPYQLIVHTADGRAAHRAVAVAPGAQGEPVTVRLEDGATLTGRVVELGTAHPIAHAEVSVWAAAGIVRVVSTDAEGRFRLVGIAPGQSGTLSVQASSDFVIEHRVLAGEAVSGTLDVGDIALLRRNRDRSFAKGDIGELGVSFRTDLFGHTSIVELLPNGAGAQAGLRVGDTILRVGDRDASGWGANALGLACYGPPGDRLALVVRSADGERTVEVTLEPARLDGVTQGARMR